MGRSQVGKAPGFGPGIAGSSPAAPVAGVRGRDRLADRQNISSGSAFEESVGYSRAVRVGVVVHVAGTTALGPSGEIVGSGDVAAQTRQALRNVIAALERAGAGARDVVRTRIYVTDISKAAAVGAVHREFFDEVRPASTMVEVAALIDPAMLVEIEAEALLSD